MYAVIRAGGKQHKVATGDVIEIEKVVGDPDSKLEFTPLLVVGDDGKVAATPKDLAKATVTAKVIGETKGDKLYVMKFKSKSRYRRKTGHRQKYSTIEIGDIKLAGAKRTSKKEND